MKDKIYLGVIIISCILLSLSFVLAEEFGYNLLEVGVGLNPAINVSTFNVNNSQFLRGFVPDDLWQSFNSQTALTGDKTMLGDFLITGNFDPNLAIGSILFINSSGLSQDNTNFFYDDSGNQLNVLNLNATNRIHAGGRNELAVVPTLFVKTSAISGREIAIGIEEEDGDEQWQFGVNQGGALEFINSFNQTPSIVFNDDNNLLIREDVIVNGSVIVDSDSTGLTLGDAEDGTIIYDGSNVLLTPDVVGSGFLDVHASGTSGTDRTILRLTSASGGAFSIAVDNLASADPQWKIASGGNEDLGFYMQGFTEEPVLWMERLEDVVLFGGTSHTSNDPVLVVVRDATGSGNAHAFVDQTQIDKTGTIGYNSFDSQIDTIGTQNYDHLASFQGRMEHDSSGTIDRMLGTVIFMTNDGGAANIVRGYEYRDLTGTGTAVIQHGLFIETLSKATTNYGITIGDSDADQNIFHAGVTGNPVWDWDESEDRWATNKGIRISSGRIGIESIPQHPLQIEDGGSAVVLKFGSNAGTLNGIFSRGRASSGNYRDFRIISNDFTIRTATSDEGLGSSDKMIVRHTTGNVEILEGDVEIRAGNLSVSGNVTSENVYLSKYIFSHTNETIPLETANVWQNVTFGQENVDLKKGINHVHLDNTNHTFGITTDGIYNIDYDFDVEDTSVGASDIDVAGRLIYANGTEIIGSVFETDITKQGTEVELSHNFLARIMGGEVVVFQFIADDEDVQISTHGTFGDFPESATVMINKIANIDP